MTHTKGPWFVSKGSDQYICSEGKWIASTMGVAGEQGAANARLIAAAPSLLEALESTVGHMLNAAITLETGTKQQAKATLESGMKIACAAIALARGEAGK